MTSSDAGAPLLSKAKCWNGRLVTNANKSIAANNSGNLFLATRLFFRVCIQRTATFDGTPTSRKLTMIRACNAVSVMMILTLFSHGLCQSCLVTGFG